MGGPFADILRADRASFNARFAEARRARPGLDPATFGHLLQEIVAPIVQAIDAYVPGQVRPVTNILYDVALDLLGQGLLGPGSRYPWITQGWTDLLPVIPQHLSAAPSTVIAAVTNALYNLSLVPDARPREWIASMIALGAMSVDVPAFLQAGQVAAWCAGLSHFRPSALDLCRRLPAPLARAALGLPSTNNALSIETIVGRLTADPWLRPAQIQDHPGGTRALKIVARTGAFRGLGGLFRSPPLVAWSGEHFIVEEGDSRWLLVADVFGATFHRTDGPASSHDTVPFKIDRSGKVSFGLFSETFPELADYSSAAASPTTLAVTSPLSYRVFLIALVEH